MYKLSPATSDEPPPRQPAPERLSVQEDVHGLPLLRGVSAALEPRQRPEHSLLLHVNTPRNTNTLPLFCSSLTRAEGNLRSSRRSTTGPGTKSLGRAGGAAYLRQGDAGDQGRDWCPEKDAKATTLSRDASGRGSIRSHCQKSLFLK